jgi:hypothetical protein
VVEEDGVGGSGTTGNLIAAVSFLSGSQQNSFLPTAKIKTHGKMFGSGKQVFCREPFVTNDNMLFGVEWLMANKYCVVSLLWPTGTRYFA